MLYLKRLLRLNELYEPGPSYLSLRLNTLSQESREQKTSQHVITVDFQVKTQVLLRIKLSVAPGQKAGLTQPWYLEFRQETSSENSEVTPEVILDQTCYRRIKADCLFSEGHMGCS